MLQSLIAILFLGFLSAYAQRPTDATIAYRQELGQIPQDISEFDVLLAVPNCDLIGHSGVLYIESQEMLWGLGSIELAEYSALVFDCAGEGKDTGHNWMIDNAIAAEVDYYFWVLHPEYVGNGIRVTVEIER